MSSAASGVAEEVSNVPKGASAYSPDNSFPSALEPGAIESQAYEKDMPALTLTTTHPKSTPVLTDAAFEDPDVAGEAIKTHELEAPPNGGLMAWLQVVAGFFNMFNSYGLLNTFGVYQDYYSREILSDHTPSQISWIGALFAALSMWGSIFVAPFIDKGHIRWVCLAGVLLNSFSMMMLSLCTKYYQVMLAQGVVMGLGAAMLFLCGVSAVAPYFSTRRGLAIGMASAGSSIGGVIYPVGLSRLMNKVGFAWSARIVGFIVLGTGLISFVCLKWRLPPRRAGSLVDFAGFKDARLTMYSICLLLAFSSLYVVTFYVQQYTVEVSHSAPTSFYTAAIFNGASTCGRVLPNFLSDHIGRFNILVPALTIATIMTFAWTRIHSLGGMIVFSVIHGMGTAPFISLFGPIAASLTPDLRKLGIRLGYISLWTGLGGLLAAPMAGIILRKYGWTALQCFSGALSAAALVCAICTRQMLAPNRYGVFEKV